MLVKGHPICFGPTVHFLYELYKCFRKETCFEGGCLSYNFYLFEISPWFSSWFFQDNDVHGKHVLDALEGQASASEIDRVYKYLEEVEQITKLTVGLAIRLNRIKKLIERKAKGTKEQVMRSSPKKLKSKCQVPVRGRAGKQVMN